MHYRRASPLPRRRAASCRSLPPPVVYVAICARPSRASCAVLRLTSAPAPTPSRTTYHMPIPRLSSVHRQSYVMPPSFACRVLLCSPTNASCRGHDVHASRCCSVRLVHRAASGARDGCVHCHIVTHCARHLATTRTSARPMHAAAPLASTPSRPAGAPPVISASTVCVMPRAVSLCVVIAPSWSTPSCSQPPVTWHTPSTLTLSPRPLLCASTQARPLLRTTRSVPQATQTPRPPRSCALVLTHSTSFFNWFSASTSLSLKRYSAPNIPRVWHLSNFSPTHPCIKSITMSLLTAEGLPHPPLPRRRAASCHHRSPSPTSSSTVAVVHPTITHATVTSPFPFLF